MTKLTKRIIDATRASSREQLCWDDELPGFGVRIKPSGAKSFLIQYRNKNGRSRRLTIGRYGVMTPDEARTVARLRLAEVAKGNDPAEQRAMERAAVTVKDLCREYLKAAESGDLLTKSRQPKAASTIATDRGRIERHIIPLLGHRPTTDITSADIERFRRDVKNGKTKTDVKTTKLRGRAIVKGGAGTATRTLGLLSGIFTYAVKMRYCPTNPVHGVARDADGTRHVVLTPHQYKALGETLSVSDASWQAKDAIRLIALTGCRRGEVVNLRWTAVNFKARCLALETKTGKSIRPLGTATLKLLKDLRTRSNSEFVFPGINNLEGPYGGLPRMWQRIANDAGLTRLTLHGLRHACAGSADQLGLSIPTIGALLGQSSSTLAVSRGVVFSQVTFDYIYKSNPELFTAADRLADRIAYMMGHSGF